MASSNVFVERLRCRFELCFLCFRAWAPDRCATPRVGGGLTVVKWLGCLGHVGPRASESHHANEF